MRRLFYYSAFEEAEGEEALSLTVLSALVLSRLELSLGRDVSELLLSVVVLPEEGIEVVMSPFSPQPVRQTRPTASTAARRIETIFFMLIYSFCRKISGNMLGLTEAEFVPPNNGHNQYSRSLKTYSAKSEKMNFSENSFSFLKSMLSM